MYATSFSKNDLLRRKSQTCLAVICLTLSVTSTLFLLLFSSRIGVGIASLNQNILTMGLLRIFSQFIWFIGFLIFVVGAILTSFVAFLMMSQRTKDFGLIKAAGCPNDLLFGYYMVELFSVTLASCTLGIVFGLILDYAVAGLSSIGVYQNSPNLLSVPLVFVAFLLLAILFGTRPILSATRLSPSEALSPVQHYGLAVSVRAKPFAKSNLTIRIALRSLFRRRIATVRIVVLLSIVFILLTVSIAGSIIAKETTMSWIQKPYGQNTIAIAQESMALQYGQLQSAFTGTTSETGFNYTDSRLTVATEIIERLHAVKDVVKVDERLILKERLSEVANFAIDTETMTTTSVGDTRQADVLIIGVNPNNTIGEWFMQGRFLDSDSENGIVLGDSTAQTLVSQPLVQSIRIRDKQFAIVGVCVDSLENGRVVYVPLKQLQNITGIDSTNIIFLSLNQSANYTELINEINGIIVNSGSALTIFDINTSIRDNITFLDSIWSTIMLLPLFSLGSAALCLTAYVILAIDEQREELGFLRAMGAKPKALINMVAIQSTVVLSASVGAGLSLGTIATLLVLIQQPVVTNLTLIEISIWLIAASIGMFVLSLIPAIRFARTSLLEIIT